MLKPKMKWGFEYDQITEKVRIIIKQNLFLLSFISYIKPLTKGHLQLRFEFMIR